MSLISCPECGKEISDKAASCPNCGYPIGRKINENFKMEYDEISEENEQHETYAENRNEDAEDEEQKASPFSIVALILSITLFLSIFGLIIAIIDLKTPDGKNKKWSKWAIGICCFWMLIILIPTKNKTNEKSSDKKQESNTQSEIKDSDEIQITSNEDEEPKTDEEDTAVQEIQVFSPEEITYEDIFFYDLMDNIDQYNGHYVRTVIQVYRCYQSENESYIQSQYPDYNLVENSDNIKVYPDNYEEFQSGEYITVEGRLAKNGNDDVLANAHIVDCGENSKNVFESDLSVRLEDYNQNLQQEKESFIESCVSVSYEELRKYPDTYQDTPIKLTIYIKDVEPDGLIFLGDIIATLNGEELAVYDDRIVREPRITEGETITIYATGNGLATMKVKQKGVVFNKTVDEYEVPAVKIKYTENDKDFSENMTMDDLREMSELREYSEQEESEREETKKKFTYDKMDVCFIEYKIENNAFGEECLVVYFDFTNNSNENQTFIYNFSVKAFQNGVEMESSLGHVNDETKNHGKEIQPGTTIRVADAFYLVDKESKIEIEIEPWISLSDEKLFEMEIFLTE